MTAANNIVQITEVKARLPMTQGARARGITPAQWRVLVEQTFPAAKSVEAVELAIDYCVARNLDIFKKPVHIVPMYSAAKRGYVETLWPGINEVQITAARTGQWAGMDSPKWGPMITETLNGFKTEWRGDNKINVKASIEITYPEWCEVTVYRLIGGQPRAFCEPVYWKEAYSTAGGKDSALPTDMWVKRPRGQLHKVAKAASLRAAFPEEGELTAEEMEGKVTEAGGVVIDHEPAAGQIEHNTDPAEPEMTREEIEKFENDVADKLEPIADLGALDDYWRSGINARVRELGATDKAAMNRIISRFSQRKNAILSAQEADQEGVEQSDAPPAAAAEQEPAQEAPQKPVQPDPAPAAAKPRDQIDNALDALRKGDDEPETAGRRPPPAKIAVLKKADGSDDLFGFYKTAGKQLQDANDGDYGDAWIEAWAKANGENLDALKQSNPPASAKLGAFYEEVLGYQKAQRKEAEAEALVEFPTISFSYPEVGGKPSETPDWHAFLKNLHDYLGDTPNHRIAAAWLHRHSFQIDIIAKDAERVRSPVTDKVISGKAAAEEFKAALFARFPQLAD